jgi:hypothetical protein
MKKYPQTKFKWWYCVIVGLASIGDGLCMIFTLGWLSPSWTLKACMYGATKDIYRK